VHIVYIHCSGSPFLVSVGGEKSGRVREIVIKEVQQIQAAQIGQESHLELKIPGTLFIHCGAFKILLYSL